MKYSLLTMVIVLGEQQRDSAICIHVFILPLTPIPSKLPHDIEQSSLCYILGPRWLSILNIAVCTCPSQTPWLSLPPSLVPKVWEVEKKRVKRFQITSAITWKSDLVVMDQAILTSANLTFNNQKIKRQHRSHKVYDYEVLRNITKKSFLVLKNGCWLEISWKDVISRKYDKNKGMYGGRAKCTCECGQWLKLVQEKCACVTMREYIHWAPATQKSNSK